MAASVPLRVSLCAAASAAASGTMGVAAPTCMQAAAGNLSSLIWRHASLKKPDLPGTHLVILHQDSLRAGFLLLHCSAFPIAV